MNNFETFSQVIDRTANMIIGVQGLTPDRVMVMMYTKSFTQHSIVFTYTDSFEHFTPLARLMAPFQGCLWISFAIVLSFAIVVILISKKLTTRQRHFVIGGRVNRTPILNMLNVVIGNAAHMHYLGAFSRTLLLLWILFCFIIRNSYQGSLYEFLVSNINRPVHKIKLNVILIVAKPTRKFTL